MLRPRVEADNPQLEQMLRAAGLERTEMGLHFPTWVLADDNQIKGFFTLRKEHGLPYVEHFCVDQSHRARVGVKPPFAGWALLRGLKRVIRELGFDRLILNAKAGDQFVEKIIQRVFKTKAYAQIDGVSFFLTEVSNG